MILRGGPLTKALFFFSQLIYLSSTPSANRVLGATSFSHKSCEDFVRRHVRENRDGTQIQAQRQLCASRAIWPFFVCCFSHICRSTSSGERRGIGDARQRFNIFNDAHGGSCCLERESEAVVRYCVSGIGFELSHFLPCKLVPPFMQLKLACLCFFHPSRARAHMQHLCRSMLNDVVCGHFQVFSCFFVFFVFFALTSIIAVAVQFW